MRTPQRIADEALRDRIRIALDRGQARSALFFELKAEWFRIGQARLARLWEIEAVAQQRPVDDTATLNP